MAPASSIACVETYGRPRTLEMLQGLETVAERSIEYRGTTFEEMDTDAVIQRDPEIALVDELAHTNVPGSRRGKRWEDVIDLLAAGIEVITTVNIQHLESLNDVVADVTGVRQRETVPDWVVELADQIELVDMSPHALQRRMLHGNVYPDPAKAELALQRYFTTDNLTALRELALMRVAEPGRRDASVALVEGPNARDARARARVRRQARAPPMTSCGAAPGSRSVLAATSLWCTCASETSRTRLRGSSSSNNSWPISAVSSL